MIRKLLATTIVFLSLNAKSQLYLLDNFDTYNTAGPTNGLLNGQNNWTNGYVNFNLGTGDAPPINFVSYRGKIINSPMIIPNFLNTSKVLQIASQHDGIGKIFPPGVAYNGSIYMALPFSINSFKRYIGPNPTDSTDITAQVNILRAVYKLNDGEFPTTACRFFVKPVVGGYNIGCSKALNTATYKTNPTLLTNFQNVLVVLKYTFVPGANNDIVSLYINPNLALNESSNTPEVEVVGLDDAPEIQGVNLNFNNNNNPNTFIGGVYASATWPSIQNALPLSCIDNLQLNKISRDRASLTWSATNCKAVKSFTLQQSTNGKDFKNIELINNQGEKGNYASTFNLLDGANFIRLAITDIHGQTIYSSVLTISKNNTSLQNINLYPNPAKDLLNVAIKTKNPEEFNFQVLSNQVNKINFVGESNISIDIKDFSKGIYLLKVTNKTGETTINKFYKN
jgi:hypothetical protein